MIEISAINTPIGILQINATDKGVFSLKLNAEDSGSSHKSNIILDAENQIMEYFYGNRKEFTFKINFENGTDFQKKVWKALLDIPYGITRTYGDIAKIIGNSRGYRAVGNANNKNPLPIIVPCHRVVGYNNNLTGYAYGLKVKKYLLELEKKNY